MVQLLYPYMKPGKTIYLTIQIFVSKAMSLLCNTLSKFVIVFLPRNKCVLISWLQSSSAMILEPKKIKSVTVSVVSPIICYEVMRLNAMIFVFLNVEFYYLLFLNFILFLNFTILYWFCQISK